MNLILILLSIISQISIYTHSVTDVNGVQKSLSSFSGKKIMLVNIATGSNRVNQLAGLQQLHNLYHDSLIIIAFPSNSFGKESRSNGQIKQFCQNNYNAAFIIAQKKSVTSNDIQPIYSWLGNANQNGFSSINIISDFEKILIDKYGDIIAVFGPTVQPTDASIINAITNN